MYFFIAEGMKVIGISLNLTRTAFKKKVVEESKSQL